MAAEMGGDTDTIAALAGGLLSVVNGTEQLDSNTRTILEGHNNLAIMI
jgi:ADP-ribosylglycohydrolase